MKLILEGIKKNFGKKQVILDATCEFEQGNIYGIIGRNGAGKTTLFNCLTSSTKMDEGSIILEIDGIQNYLTFSDIGMVSASPSLPDFLTGYEFIKCFIEIHENNIEDKKTIDDYFDLVKLTEDDRHQLLKTYSYGMKNKIQLLTCLIRKPYVILLDEPLTSFDIIVSHDIKALLLDMKKDHIILMSTHILQLAQDICDDILILGEGILSQTEFNLGDDQMFEASIVSALKEVR